MQNKWACLCKILVSHTPFYSPGLRSASQEPNGDKAGFESRPEDWQSVGLSFTVDTPLCWFAKWNKHSIKPSTQLRCRIIDYMFRAERTITRYNYYKVVQIWPGQTVTCLHTNSPGHIWTTLYIKHSSYTWWWYVQVEIRSKQFCNVLLLSERT